MIGGLGGPEKFTVMLQSYSSKKKINGLHY